MRRTAPSSGFSLSGRYTGELDLRVSRIKYTHVISFHCPNFKWTFTDLLLLYIEFWFILTPSIICGQTSNRERQYCNKLKTVSTKKKGGVWLSTEKIKESLPPSLQCTDKNRKLEIKRRGNLWSSRYFYILLSGSRHETFVYSFNPTRGKLTWKILSSFCHLLFRINLIFGVIKISTLKFSKSKFLKITSKSFRI